MKKSILLLIFTIYYSLFTIHCSAQWVLQKSGTSANLKSVYFTDSNNGWAVGEQGTILNTTDGGSTWTLQNSGTAVTFWSISNGYAVGDSAKILQYNGSEWALLELSGIKFTNPFTFYSSQYISNEIWIAGGDTINYSGYFLINNDTNWKGGQLPGFAPISICTYDLKHIFMILNSYDNFYIFHCSDGISSPLFNQPINGQTYSANRLSSLCLLDKNNGWCVGDSGYIYSYEKDSLWISQPTGFYKNYYSVYFPDTNHGWVVGDDGRIEKYLSGTWRQDSSGVNYKLNSVYFPDINHGWIVGDSGTILSINTTPPSSVNVIPVNPTICGPDSITFNVTADGATPFSYQWTKDDTVINGATNNIYRANISGTYACIVTNFSGSSTSNSSTLTIKTFIPSAAEAIIGKDVICSGTKGIIYSVPSIANAIGYVWTLPEGATIHSGDNTNSIIVFFSDSAKSGNITVYGTNGCGDGQSSPNYAITITTNPLLKDKVKVNGKSTICQGKNAQLTVESQESAINYQWEKDGVNIRGATISSYFADSTGNYTVLETDTNGCSNTLNPITITVNPIPLTPVITLTKNKDTLLSSSIEGNQWYFKNMIINGAKDQIYLPKLNGTYYVIVTIDSCMSDTSNKINFMNAGVNELKMQNGELRIKIYPNPANSFTVVSYQLSENNFVSIKLYDITGIEIATLVNGQKEIGDYKINFNTENLKGGVYFYKLKAGNYSYVDKVIIIK